MLPLNRQDIFKILNVTNDQTDYKNESFESENLQAFLNISKELNAGSTTGSEIYSEKLLPLINENVMLSDSILNLLINYYNRAYVEYNFSRLQLDSYLSNVNYIAVTEKVL